MIKRPILLRGWRAALFLMTWLVGSVMAAPAPGGTEVPLVIGNRTIHTFRETLGALSPEERAAAARLHINQALAGGEGWTSILPVDQGVLVALDGRPMFTVLPGDARKEAGESPEVLANQASRVLQQVWTEARERRQTGIPWKAWGQVASALALLALTLGALVVITRLLRKFILGRLAAQLKSLSGAGIIGSRFSGVILRLMATVSALLSWLLGLLGGFAFISYALGRFALTRPFSEDILRAVMDSVIAALQASAAALPGIFLVVLIFALARIITQITHALFDHIAAGRMQWGAFDAHTAPASRYLVNAAVWLFAVAMAYPYFPGSHTEAFKGLSVLLGIMVSIGAAGPVGHIASGLILVYTRALLVGEYVRIQDREGIVTHLGLCVTRLRTSTGEEIALPNSVVMGNITRNFSRRVERGGQVIETGVTIGYDTPWRQVHAMLLESAARIPAVHREPAPFVAQTALSDFYVAYNLVVQADPGSGGNRLQVVSDLNAAIQDVFNHYGVQIMSPHYRGDPAQPKVVPESQRSPKPATPAS